MIAYMVNIDLNGGQDTLAGVLGQAWAEVDALGLSSCSREEDVTEDDLLSFSVSPGWVRVRMANFIEDAATGELATPTFKIVKYNGKAMTWEQACAEFEE